MKALRIGFLFKRPYRAGFVSIFPKAMQALAEAGVVVDVVACNERLIDLSTVRVEHDLYVLRQISGVSMSLAGALHAQGAAIVNPYPVTVALRDKVIAARILAAAGAPVPATYVVSQPDLLAPLLNRGPLVVKPYDGTCGSGVHVVRNEADLLAEPRPPHKPPILAQRYHQPQGPNARSPGDRVSSRRSRWGDEMADRDGRRLRGEPRDQPRHHPSAPRRNPDEREPPRRLPGERRRGRARAPTPPSERRPPLGAGRGRLGGRGGRRPMRAPAGAVPGAHRGAPDPRGLPPRRAPRRARLAARARPRPASGCARAGSLRRPPRRVVLRPMGRRYAPRADRGRGLAAPVGRRGSRGRDRAVVPPRICRARLSLELSRGAGARAADAVRPPRATRDPRPGDPPDWVPAPVGARDRGDADSGGDMTTAVISVYKVASFPEGGGHFWVYLQYALGLRRLGCDVYWLEQLRPARDPERQTYVISTFQERMKQFGFEGRTLLYTLDGEPRLVGGTWSEAEAVMQRADVLLNFHYAIDPRILACARRTALVDIDPGLLQFWMSSGQLKVPAHDCYLTTGETVGTPAARFSDCGLRWT